MSLPVPFTDVLKIKIKIYPAGNHESGRRGEQHVSKFGDNNISKTYNNKK